MALATDTSPSNRRPWGRSLWLTVLILALALGGVAYVQRRDMAIGPASRPLHDPASAPVPVAVERAASGSFPIYLSGLGTVTALHTVTVRSRVDGELVRIAFTEGQLVKPGDLLAEVDPRPFQIQLLQAEGQLAKDRALLKNAEVDLARYRTLLAQDSIAVQQVTTQEYLVKQLQGTVEMDQAQVDNARLQLAYSRITAPIAGRVGLRLVDQGNIVQAGDANGIVVITQTQPITVVFSLPEDEVPAVLKRWRSRPDIPVEAYDRAGKVQLATGQLIAVDNQIDPTTGTVKLKAQFANEDRALFANQFVNVRMKLDTLQAAVTVPTAAVQRGSVGSFVYAVGDAGTVSVRPVKLGPAEGQKVVVLEGLAAGEAVVVDGADKLREGATVEVARGGAASAETPKAAGSPAP